MQASLKTHVQYGGSGLGLFISRQLVEMQGGEIGSTFQFFIKTRRTVRPAESEETDFQLLVRDDALREAYGFELTSLQQNGTKMPPVTLERVNSHLEWELSPASKERISEVFHILVVEGNLVN